MKYLVLITSFLILMSCTEKKPTISLGIHSEILKKDTIYYLKVNVENKSLESLYLENLNHIASFIRAFDSNGLDITEEFNKYLYYDGRQSLERESSFLNETMEPNSQFVDSAVAKDIKRITKINLFLKIDSVRYQTIRNSLIDKYADVILLKPGENITQYLLINSFYKTKWKVKISFNYKTRTCFNYIPGFMHSYKHIEGRDDKFFIIMARHGLNEVDGYKRFKGKIISAPLVIN